MKKSILSLIVTALVAIIVSVPAFATNVEVSQIESTEYISEYSIYDDSDYSEDKSDEYNDEFDEDFEKEAPDFDDEYEENFDEEDQDFDEEDDEEESMYKVENPHIEANKVKVTLRDDEGVINVALNTDFMGEVKKVSCDSENTVWIDYITGELHAWNPNIDPDVDTFIPYAFDCEDLVIGGNGYATGYITSMTYEQKGLASFEDLLVKYDEDFECLVLKQENQYGFFDYIFINDFGMKEDSISQISKRKYIYDSEKIKTKKFDLVTFNEYGEVIALKKKKVYTLTENNKDKYVFKCFAKKIQELHINENSGLAEYIVNKKGETIECSYEE